jgi:sulfate adenylyltransferase
MQLRDPWKRLRTFVTLSLMASHLIAPHGGNLVDCFAGSERAEELKELSGQWPSWNLTSRQICDLELLLCGGFSPLSGFMTRADCQSVLTDMKLQDGTFWPVPLTLDLPEKAARGLCAGGTLVLRDLEGVAVAVLHIEDVFERPDAAAGSWCLGGRVEGIQPVQHYDFTDLRLTPAETRKRFEDSGWRRVVAFQPRGVMYRAEQEFTREAALALEAGLLIHPAVGLPEAGDADHYTRVRCLQAAVKRYPAGMATLGLLPLAEARAAEALLRAIVQKNYGCSHLFSEEEHPSLKKHQNDTGVEPVRLERDEQALPSTIEQIKEHLGRGREIPPRLAFPEVIRELERTYPPRSRQGFTVFFTGLPSAGKSTIANVLLVNLMEIGFLPVTLLDGDIVRRHLSSELGFSREHRDINIRRIGFVASEITKNGGIAICAPIAPYASVRKEVREMIAPRGGFVLVHVATPISICEDRDRKGLYAKARKGIIKKYTGISDPYETPEDADLSIDTSALTPKECAGKVILHLEKQGYIEEGRS